MHPKCLDFEEMNGGEPHGQADMGVLYWRGDNKSGDESWRMG